MNFELEKLHTLDKNKNTLHYFEVTIIFNQSQI
jgi:hypothetical protein